MLSAPDDRLLEIFNSSDSGPRANQDGGRHLEHRISTANSNEKHPEARILRRATGVGTPSLTEMLKESQKAMEAAASLGSPDTGSYKLTQDDHEQSGSEVESELSHSSDRIGTNVTPGTSDCII
ncbi:hypothetical protein NDU88_002786 [Pleurodeles waltl]|uniref:Uncharacterized protein n=1 Tax=Pleurodeles waltl TaxID=8319 RepID=A0AAV7WR83_PLEWA|nr:hypothetical protein NDU88_002786 [Pleurodeles waltl]